MSVVDEIKARIDIIDLVSETVQLRRTGKNYSGFCPFHSNTRTPAFAVFPDTGTWRCFGQCNEGGDIFGFVMKKEGWDFPEALRYLAEKAGVELRPQTPEEQVAAEEHDQLRVLLEEALTFYRHQLLNTPAGKPALDYLHQRGLQDDTIEAFGLGYAPDAWEAASSYFKSKGYREDDLLQAGLVSERDGGEAQGRGVYDRFRNRVMFPIRDERGRMAGFGARILNPEDVPKFLNSPQTAVFDKGRLLYGLDRARKAIRDQDQSVIVEGYLDVIALHQAGYTNAVSPMGTALTEHHLYLLKRFSRRIVLALDPDAAGQMATFRGIDAARQALDYVPDIEAIRYSPRDLTSYEVRLQADIRVTTLPEELDPDEVVNRDPKEWERLVEEAKPIVIHVMDYLAKDKNLDDPKVKEEIVSQVVPLIRDIPSDIERETYRQRLARLVRIKEDTLNVAHIAKTRPARRRSKTQRTAPAQAGESVPALGSGVYAQESHILGVLMRRPDLLYRVDRLLQELGLGRLSPADFQHADHQAILQLLQASVDQDMAEPLNYVLNSLSLPMMEIADGLLARTGNLNPSDERVIEDILRGLIAIRQQAVRQNVDYVRYLMEDAQQQGSLKVTQYQQTMVQHTRVLQQLNLALGQITSRDATRRTIINKTDN